MVEVEITSRDTTPEPSLNEISEEVLDTLLGVGLSHLEWKGQLIRRRYQWNEGLKLRIIRMEYQKFKLEIGDLLAEPNADFEFDSRSNPYSQIMKRLTGKTGQREQRLANRTLFGSSGKYGLPSSSTSPFSHPVGLIHWSDTSRSGGLRIQHLDIP
jgi:hypothetical protein